MPKKDEEKVLEEINRHVKEKGFIAWLKDGRLSVHPDVLAQCLNPTLAESYMMSQSSASGVVQGESNVSPHTLDQQGHGVQPPERMPGYGCEDLNVQQQQTYFRYTIPASAIQDSVTGKLVLKSKIRYGYISFAKKDVKFLSPEFEEVLYQQNFIEHFRNTAEVEVKIMFVPKNNIFWVLKSDWGVEMASNDLLLLKTRVINGKISFCGSDVEVCYPNWKVPEHITKSFENKAYNGTLFIISDEQGNLRSVVQHGTMDEVIGWKDRAFTAFFASLPNKKSQK